MDISELLWKCFYLVFTKRDPSNKINLVVISRGDLYFALQSGPNISVHSSWIKFLNVRYTELENFTQYFPMCCSVTISPQTDIFFKLAKFVL